MYNVAYRISKGRTLCGRCYAGRRLLKAFIKIDAYQNEVAFGAWLKK
jgi:hypothetical protein